MSDQLKVFVNKEYTGNLFFENEKYIFNYNDKANDIVSLVSRLVG